MKDIVQLFDQIMRKYTPDPYIIAMSLTFIVSLMAFIFTPSSINDITLAWGSGFWKLLTFTLQMAMILLGGYLVASSNFVQRSIKLLCSPIKTPTQAIVFATLTSGLASWVNWGFGLVIGAFLAIELVKVVPKTNFRVLVASSYSGFLFWHAGLSGSIPLVVNTEQNFSLQWVGRLIPLSETVFSTFNIVALLGLAVLLPLTNWYLMKSTPNSEAPAFSQPIDHINCSDIESNHDQTFAQKLESGFWMPLLFSCFAFYYLILTIFRGEFRLDLNTINFIFLFLGLLLHWKTKYFLASIKSAAGKLGPIIVQYPLYAGIMGIMRETGLATLISDFFVNTSSPTTFPLFTFLGAGLVNFFVPSGGGQWAVQAPVVMPAANALGVDIPLSIMAIAWGDAWTNMAQPFWALPVLAIAGLGAKDILGFTLTALIVSGIYLSALFLIFASF